MNKRDLKADLGHLKRTKKVFEPQQVTFETPEDEIVPSVDLEEQQLYTLVGLGEFVVEHGEEWLERAIKAEALARELARELEEIKRRGDWLKRDCTEPDKVMIYATDISIIGNGTLAKAEEVLEDE